MGPGIFIKSLLRGSFSLLIFGWAQILMDIEPLVALLKGEEHLHGLSHTYMGAIFIGLAAAITGYYLIKVLQISYLKNNLSKTTAFISALIGTISHVGLDSIMHSDMTPFYPLGITNGLLGYFPVEILYDLCTLSGLIGSGIFVILNWRTFK